MTSERVEPVFFATPAEFRDWLSRHHLTAAELVVGFHRKATGRPSLTWPESVDEALCAGWIDGVRRRHDAESYTIRFTPRRKGSIWSAINIKRVAVLTAEGRMLAAGLEAFARRTDRKSGIYSYEQRHEAEFDARQLKQLRANRKAWAFFTAQPPSYRRLMTFWVTTAKQAPTRATRLERLIAACAKRVRLR